MTPLYIHAVYKLQCTSVYAGPTVYLQTVTPHHGVRTHPGVFLLYLSVTNHDLLPIRFCRAKVVRKLPTLHDHFQGDQAGSQGVETEPAPPPPNTKYVRFITYMT